MYHHFLFAIHKKRREINPKWNVRCFLWACSASVSTMNGLQHYIGFDSLADSLRDSPMLSAVFAASLTIFLVLYLTRSSVTPVPQPAASRHRATNAPPLVIRIPPAETTCTFCFEEPKGCILRCSNCKNQFYCVRVVTSATLPR